MANVDTLPEILRPLMEGAEHRDAQVRRVRRAVAAQPPPHREARGGQAVPRRARGSQAHGDAVRQRQRQRLPRGWRTPTGCTSAGSGPSRGSTAPPRRARGTGSTCCCRNRPSTRMPWPWTAGVGCRGAGGACERVRAFKRVEPPARVLRVRPQGTVEPARPVGGPHVPGVPLLRPRAGALAARPCAPATP